MKPPICRLCGMPHWGVDHVWPRATREALAREALARQKPEQEIESVELELEDEKAAAITDTAGQSGPGKAGDADLGEVRPEGLGLIARPAAMQDPKQAEIERKRAQSREYMRAYRKARKDKA